MTLHLKKSESLRALPVSLFGSVMGLSGLTLGWRLAQTNMGAPAWIAQAIALIAVADFVFLCVAYGFKCLLHWDAVRAEFSHPISGSFFGTFTIALLLMAAVLRPFDGMTATVFWTVGTVLTLAMAYVSISGLMGHMQSWDVATPAWIIPGVGVLDIPVTSGGILWAGLHQINLLAFAVGAFWALVLVVLIIARIVLRGPIPATMTPSLMILFAPFPVAFLGFITGISHHLGVFVALLFYFGVFLFAVLVPRVFRRGMVFGPPWWAISFPMAALANSAVIYAHDVHVWPLRVSAMVLLFGVTAVIGWLLVASLAAHRRGTFLVQQKGGAR